MDFQVCVNSGPKKKQAVELAFNIDSESHAECCYRGQANAFNNYLGFERVFWQR